MGRFRLLVVCLLSLLVLVPAGAQSLDQSTAEEISALVLEQLKRQEIPGLSLAIARDSRVVFERGYGYADLENHVKASERSVYRLASISKMVTAVAVLQLAQQDKLDLGAPIQKYLPKFPEKKGVITAELLLKHQSGIRHYRGREIESVVHYNRVQDSFPIFQDDPLLFAPGTRYSYTTYGFNILGGIIESASGQDYVSYIREHILQPAKIETMVPDNPFTIIENRAAGYRIVQRGQAKELQNDLMVDISNKIPGGGWCSTARDLVLFASALMDGRLLPEDALTKMWTRQATTTGQMTNSGLGCFLKETENGQRVSHSGGQPKVSTLLLFWPEEKTAIGLMCNLRNAKLEPLAERVHQRLMKTATSE